ncbi:unnamed protein product [Toxocara canis]|uniref:Proteoglycan 4-like n=1 Tax=Toxocara canis TaxID=6265 RepID=A0A183V4I4_TOXCA|nr:unnamed protein product [Toxocara canis]
MTSAEEVQVTQTEKNVTEQPKETVSIASWNTTEQPKETVSIASSNIVITPNDKQVSVAVEATNQSTQNSKLDAPADYRDTEANCTQTSALSVGKEGYWTASVAGNGTADFTAQYIMGTTQIYSTSDLPSKEQRQSISTSTTAKEYGQNKMFGYTTQAPHGTAVYTSHTATTTVRNRRVTENPSQTRRTIVGDRRVSGKASDIASTRNPLPSLNASEQTLNETTITERPGDLADQFDEDSDNEYEDSVHESPPSLQELDGHTSLKPFAGKWETPKQPKKLANQILFFGIAGLSLLSAALSAVVFCLVYSGTILAPHQKPTPPNVLPSALL